MNLNKQVFEVDWQAIHGQVAAADNTRPFRDDYMLQIITKSTHFCWWNV